MYRKHGHALIVGAGIGGMRAALDLAEYGYGVTLIDRSPRPGGVLARLDRQFPTDGCGMCRMLPHFDRDRAGQQCLRKGLFHENIDILPETELVSVKGEPGNFKVTLRSRPNPVDPDRCIGCGACSRVCPVELPDPFNADTATRKAIDLPWPHAAPGPYHIDTDACSRCGKCLPVCPTGAIRFPDGDRKDFSILVVDDERIVRESLKDWLEIEGRFAVYTADSGPAALELLESHPVNLMLLDIKMPGMDGVTVLQKARERLPELTVLMITAYATVETAVEAMKIGALDYLVKPFDPEALIPRIIRIHDDLRLAATPERNVGAIVLAAGADYYDPRSGTNPFGYGVIPDVLTGLEFERRISGTGPTGGRLLRPSDGSPARRIAWIQCVGSRDISTGADFCSGICCMVAVKEARLAKRIGRERGLPIDTDIFYIDMRTFGKGYQQYRDQAEAEGVGFIRGRVHSITADPERGDLSLRFATLDGTVETRAYDMAILAVGQRPGKGISGAGGLLEIDVDARGFIAAPAFSPGRTSRDGIFAAGTCTGFKDIGEAVIGGSSAALNASRVLHASGGDLAPRPGPAAVDPARFMEPPELLVAVCPCNGAATGALETESLARNLTSDPVIRHVVFADQLCTDEGRAVLAERIRELKPNRVLIGACTPFRKAGDAVPLPSEWIDRIDIRSLYPDVQNRESGDAPPAHQHVEQRLRMAAERLKRIDPVFAPATPVRQAAMVVGGGVAGMTAALGIADHGFEVHLVEATDRLGGNLNWLRTTLDGQDAAGLLEQLSARVEQHPHIRVYLDGAITGARGMAGDFTTTVKTGDSATRLLRHGAAVLATGGREARVSGFGYGTSPRILTQKELEEQLHNGTVDPRNLNCVAMILCAGTRQPPDGYCSRICCSTALKHALRIAKANPAARILVFYRDMMAYGAMEADFTRARKAGVVFIPYTREQKPDVRAAGENIVVIAREPIIGRDLQVTADMVVLAAGIVPALPEALAGAFGAETDPHGFFREAEPKWRPVESLREGGFACGLAHSPRNLTESIATAEAAAARAIRLLARAAIPAGRATARVRQSLCSRCQRCVAACPYGARIFDPESEEIQVNSAMCQGCGACATACPNFAAFVADFTPGRMLAEIDAAVE